MVLNERNSKMGNKFMVDSFYNRNIINIYKMNKIIKVERVDNTDLLCNIIITTIIPNHTRTNIIALNKEEAFKVYNCLGVLLNEQGKEK